MAETESKFRRQLASYFDSKGGSFPEWYIMQLERASISDRIQMLRDRGILDLPYEPLPGEE